MACWPSLSSIHGHVNNSINFDRRLASIFLLTDRSNFLFTANPDSTEVAFKLYCKALLLDFFFLLWKFWSNNAARASSFQKIFHRYRPEPSKVISFWKWGNVRLCSVDRDTWFCILWALHMLTFYAHSHRIGTFVVQKLWTTSTS